MDPSQAPADVPDIALVAPCDRTNNDVPTNGDLANELTHARRERDDCADRMDSVATWRADAIKRAAPIVGSNPK